MEHYHKYIKYKNKVMQMAGSYKNKIISKYYRDTKPTISTDKNKKKTASPRNCLIRYSFVAPTTFLKPISLERFEERAVERFIKFIHAVTIIKKPIARNM